MSSDEAFCNDCEELIPVDEYDQHRLNEHPEPGMSELWAYAVELVGRVAQDHQVEFLERRPMYLTAERLLLWLLPVNNLASGRAPCRAALAQDLGNLVLEDHSQHVILSVARLIERGLSGVSASPDWSAPMAEHFYALQSGRLGAGNPRRRPGEICTSGGSVFPSLENPSSSAPRCARLLVQKGETRVRAAKGRTGQATGR